MKFNDAVIGIVLLLLAGGMIAVARTFPAMPGQAYGPALFPTLLALGLACCGALLVVGGLRRRAGEKWFQPAPWVASPRLVANFLSVPVGLVFYILAADTLGFLLTAFLLLAAVLMLVRRGRPVSSLIVAVVATLAIHQAFTRLLLVPLPRGLLPL